MMQQADPLLAQTLWVPQQEPGANLPPTCPHLSNTKP